MRLLHKTIRSYFLASFVILLVTIPLFYFILKAILAEDVDRNLRAQKEAIVRRLDRAVLFDPFDLLDALEPDVNLSPSRTIRLYDTLYTVHVRDRLSGDRTPYRVLSSNVIIRGRYYVIELKNSLLSNESLLETIVLVQTILLLLIGGGLVFMNRRLSAQIWKPFNHTLQKLRTYKVEQETAIQLTPSDIDEFNDLNHTVEQLTERNRAVYQSQKEFTENASHEMQTPLAILQTKLELLMQTEPMTEEQATLITDLADANSRLSKLNKSLLLLSKIENNQYPETEEVDLGSLCQKVVQQLSFQADAKNIRIEEQYRQTATVKVNRVLMEILFSNLVSNAIRYNREGGLLRIEGSANRFVVQNTSELPPLNGEKIFQRFHKEGNHRQSVGLGLAISRKICSLYGFQLQYQFADGLHTFTLVV